MVGRRNEQLEKLSVQARVPANKLVIIARGWPDMHRCWSWTKVELKVSKVNMSKWSL